MKFTRRPLPFVLCASHHGSMIVNHKDYRMVGPNQGYGVGYQLLNSAAFDPDEVDLVLQLLSQRQTDAGAPVVAIDAGANVGVHTLEWARHMHGWGQVIAVEAQERIYYALAGNIALNNCFNARALHAALGAQCGQMRIPQPDYNVAASFGSLELRAHAHNEAIGQPIDYTDASCQPVQVLTIDAIAPERVDFIKIDVEGMELEVLAGARATLQRCHPIMLIETIKSDKAALQALLQGHEYRSFPMGINVLAVHAHDPVAARIRVTRT